MPLPALKATIVLPAFTRSLPADGNILYLSCHGEYLNPEDSEGEITKERPVSLSPSKTRVQRPAYRASTAQHDNRFNFVMLIEEDVSLSLNMTSSLVDGI
jgi:hypothetical protein